MINPKLGYSDKTQELIERMCRNVERLDFVLDKSKAEECILKTFDLFGLDRPRKIQWCIDFNDKDFAWSALSAWSAGSAWSAESAWLAWLAGSAWSAWSVWSAGSAWSALSAWSARSAGSARSALSAGSAGSARSALSAESALDYNFDYFIIEYEYCENPNNEKPNEHDLKYLKYCELLMQAKEAGLGYRVEWEDTLYLVPTPIVRINSRNQFHSDKEPAIKWKGGEKFFYLNGVKFDKELWSKVISKSLSWKDIQAIQDIDQRTQAMAYADINDFIKLGTIVDSCTKEDLEGNKVTYSLLKIPQGMFTVDAYYAIYDCPSTGKKYSSGIDPEIGKKGNIKLAMEWKHFLEKGDFDRMIPLVHES